MESSGEKILNASVTIDNRVIFTSYVPEVVSACDVGLGNSNLYILNIFDGSPAQDYEDDDEEEEDNEEQDFFTKTDRKKELVIPGISAPPSIIFPGSEEIEVMVGTEHAGSIPIEFIRRLYWSEIPDF